MIENRTDAKFLSELVTKVLRKSIGINNVVISDEASLAPSESPIPNAVIPMNSTVDIR